MKAPIRTIALTGANGFIGGHLLKKLLAEGYRVRALTRQSVRSADTNLEWVEGDLSDPGCWRRLIRPDCILVNLAYAQKAVAQEALDATAAMVDACAKSGINRLVHCSTISVYGNPSEIRINEQTACKPVDAYGRIKLAIEASLIERAQNRFEIAIARPAAVFGAGGQGLMKFIKALLNESAVKNYCRSSLFGIRKTNLVPVENVVAALQFLCAMQRPLKNEVFIVANDDEPLNNFKDVDRIVREELAAELGAELAAELRLASYPIPLLPIPQFVLETLLRLAHRPGTSTRTEYLSDKLKAWGFTQAVSFEPALRKFVRNFAENLRPHKHDGA